MNDRTPQLKRRLAAMAAGFALLAAIVGSVAAHPNASTAATTTGGRQVETNASLNGLDAAFGDGAVDDVNDDAVQVLDEIDPIDGDNGAVDEPEEAGDDDGAVDDVDEPEEIEVDEPDVDEPEEADDDDGEVDDADEPEEADDDDADEPKEADDDDADEADDDEDEEDDDDADDEADDQADDEADDDDDAEEDEGD